MLHLYNNKNLAILMAARALQAHKIIICTTDTVYGLCAHAHSKWAKERIFWLKKREKSKELIVLIDRIERLATYNLWISPVARILMEHFWPGALTLVFPVKHSQQTIGFRIPNHATVRKIIAINQAPIVATSVNMSGQASAKHIFDFPQMWQSHITYAVNMPPYPSGKSSTVVLCPVDNSIRILREGALSSYTIEQCLMHAYV